MASATTFGQNPVNLNMDPEMPGTKGGVTPHPEAAELGYFPTHRRKKSEVTDCGGVAQYHASTHRPEIWKEEARYVRVDTYIHTYIHAYIHRYIHICI